MTTLQEQSVEQKKPTLIVVLLDQASSMMDKMQDNGGKQTVKCERLAEIVNEWVGGVLSMCLDNNRYKDRVYMEVIGYSNTANVIKEGWPDEWDPDLKTLSWISPVANGGTNMHLAFKLALEAVQEWQDRLRSFADVSISECLPPVVINISDGKDNEFEARLKQPNYQGELASEMKTETRLAAEKLKNAWSSKWGNTLIMHAQLSDNQNEIVFPRRTDPLPDGFAEYLRAFSSELPPWLHDRAKAYGLIKGEYSASDAHCGLMINARMPKIEELLRFGTFINPGNPDAR